MDANEYALKVGPAEKSLGPRAAPGGVDLERQAGGGPRASSRRQRRRGASRAASASPPAEREPARGRADEAEAAPRPTCRASLKGRSVDDPRSPATNLSETAPLPASPRAARDADAARGSSGRRRSLPHFAAMPGAGGCGPFEGHGAGELRVNVLRLARPTAAASTSTPWSCTRRGSARLSRSRRREELGRRGATCSSATSGAVLLKLEELQDEPMRKALAAEKHAR